MPRNQSGDERPAKKTKVVIDEFISLNPKLNPQLPPNAVTSFPCLASFRGSTAPKKVEKMKLSLKKRRNIESTENESENQDQEVEQDRTTELFADGIQSGGRLWHGQPGFHEMYSDYLIGIRNKRTGKMKVIQVGALYSMRPYIAHQTGHHNNNSDDENGNNNTLNNSSGDEDDDDDDVQVKSAEEIRQLKYREKRMELLSAFGGRKSINTMNRNEKNAITDAKVEEQTGKSIDEAAKQMLEKDTKQGIHHIKNSGETTESSAPPHDSLATKPHEAYPLIGLLSPHEFVALEDSVTLFIDSMQDSNNEEEEEEDNDDMDIDNEGGIGSLKKQTNSNGNNNNNNMTLENPGWHPLVWSILSSKFCILSAGSSSTLTSNMVSEKDKIEMSCAMHLHYIITLANCRRKITRVIRQELAENMAVDEPVLLKIIGRFTILQRDFGHPDCRVKTDESCSIMRKHAILMWLYANAFHKNCAKIDELADALNVNIKTLLCDAVAIGCKVRKQKGMIGPEAYRLTLPLPLKFRVVKSKHLGRAKKLN